MLDIGELLQSLLPVIIFLIWLIFTIAGSASKGRRIPPDNESAENSRRQGRPRSLSDELKRSLENIFGPMEETEYEDDDYSFSKPKPEVEKTVSEAAPKKKPAKKDPYFSKAKKFPVLRTGAYEREDSVFPQIQPSAYENTPLGEDFTFDIEELPRAFIWSEIIRPPVSLRDDVREMP